MRAVCAQHLAGEAARERPVDRQVEALRARPRSTRPARGATSSSRAGASRTRGDSSPARSSSTSSSLRDPVYARRTSPRGVAADHQRAERRVDGRVGHVEQPLGRRRARRSARSGGGAVSVAAASSQRCLDVLVHAVHSSLSLLRPSNTLRRAASSEHSEQRGELGVGHPEHARGRTRLCAVLAGARAPRPTAAARRRALAGSRRRRLRHRLDRHRPPGARAVQVDRLVLRDPEQPGAQVVGATQLRIGPQGGDPGLLEDVVGLAGPRGGDAGSGTGPRGAPRAAPGRAAASHSPKRYAAAAA